MTAPELTPLLMFEGNAEAAMTFYVELFGGEVISVERYGVGEPGPEGTIKHATFRLRDLTIKSMDSPVKHAFTFTPSVSLFLTCRSENDLRGLAKPLLDGGTELMPLNAYSFSPLFVWLNDRFGVSWQLYLPPATVA
jgi:predicted 3-demethylubiquinone-9 3-methyltransferase (glyoxalase superfamily)